MFILGMKDGKPWWKKDIGSGKFEFVSESEMERITKNNKAIREKNIADIYNKAFENKEIM